MARCDREWEEFAESKLGKMKLTGVELAIARPWGSSAGIPADLLARDLGWKAPATGSSHNLAVVRLAMAREGEGKLFWRMENGMENGFNRREGEEIAYMGKLGWLSEIRRESWLRVKEDYEVIM